MIYLVTNNQELFPNDIYSIIGVDESLSLLSSISVVGLDTETSGLSAWSDNLLLVQMGCKEFQVVIDCRTIDISLYKTFLESDRLFLLWNAKFDLQWFYKYNIIIKNVYDGFLAEKLIYLGYPPGIHSLSLKSAGENYLGIQLDKSVRGKIIWSKQLTTDIIQYGADDVKYLEDIYNKQYKVLEEKQLLKAIDIENRFVRVIAYIEWCGVKIDRNKWFKKIQNDIARRDSIKEKCINWIIENMPKSEYIYYDLQGDLFADEPFDTSPKVNLNWDSPAQMVKLFKKLGVNVLDKDNKESTDIKILKPQKNKCSLIPIFIEYKEASQVCKAFGEKFLKQINPNSGRLHADWHSIGTDTARVSCGGGDEDSINLLNLPSDALTRSCFIAEEGNRWISIDYSGQESCLLASIANDKLMLDELNTGNGDIHSLVASLMFDELNGVPLKDIKSKFKHLRQEAKGYEFLIAYGGDFNTMMSNFGLQKEDAINKYNKYMNGLSGVKTYQNYRRKDWFDKGYILMSPITGYRANIYDYDKLMEDKEWISSLDWDYYREMKKSDPNCYTVTRVKNYYKRKSASEKQSINYPIQHSGAACAKIALVNFFNWIIKNGYFSKIKITIIPYDEVNCEAPEDIAEITAKKLYDCMIESGKIFCTRCKLDADISRLEDGSLPNYWIH